MPRGEKSKHSKHMSAPGRVARAIVERIEKERGGRFDGRDALLIGAELKRILEPLLASDVLQASACILRGYRSVAESTPDEVEIRLARALLALSDEGRSGMHTRIK